MTAELRVSPAASGKSTTLVRRAREISAESPDLGSRVRVVVPGYPQARAWRRALAEQGGALGVDVCTFPQLYQRILDEAGVVVQKLPIQVQIRLVQSLVKACTLEHYAPIREKTGLASSLLQVFAELKAGRIMPEALAAAIQDMGTAPWLRDISAIYTAYQEALREHDWADNAGMGWLAAETLEDHPGLCRNWKVLFVDGFDDLTPVQVDVLKILTQRLPEVAITLTGEYQHMGRLVFTRYARTLERLQREIIPLSVVYAPDEAVHHRHPVITWAAQKVLTAESRKCAPDTALEMIAVPDRLAEVRAVLRWVKSLIVHEGLPLSKIAVLARNLDPYRSYINQVSVEFGLPVHMLHDAPLAENPCVHALLQLLSLVIEDFPRQKTVDSWFSPYFDWPLALDIPVTDDSRVSRSRMLNAVSLWGKVIGGFDQWVEVLHMLAEMVPGSQENYEDVSYLPHSPVGEPAVQLLSQFTAFVDYLQPSSGDCTYRDYVRWLELLVGDFDTEMDDGAVEYLSKKSLHIMANIEAGPPHLHQRDAAALQAFKDILRGLVTADELLGSECRDYAAFYAELKHAVERAVYHLPLPAEREAVLVSDIFEVRGISFDAVAVMGLAEGEFPAVSQEDPFLPDSDREILRSYHGLQLQMSTDSYEAGYFYDAITRSTQRLLLTRPRLTDTGDLWQPSPFWNEIERLVAIEPRSLLSDTIPEARTLASFPEFFTYAARHREDPFTAWLNKTVPQRWAAFLHASSILAARLGHTGNESGMYEG
ncbi:MAG: UvrD-helicase domain-containing protein, partial [Anaerolineae bacterium]|nr:UvrD-helicase domain-containing protein [Anaerolineae bacterium]